MKNQIAEPVAAGVTLSCSPLSLTQLARLAAGKHRCVLGITAIGAPILPLPDELPLQHIAAPLLGSTGTAPCEAWLSAAPCRSGGGPGLRFRSDGQVLYGVVEVDETDYPGDGDASPLQRASENAYRRIFTLLDAEGFPHLWRVWNYLADINGEGDGLERYRQFNIGREDAFLANRRLAAGHAPAACALGVAAGPLSIAFLAGRTPAILLENPRQVSAYRYPADYGPRSPTFSRAALAHLPGQELLFVSGTASIVGHRTVHGGDVAGQTRECLANIAAVLAEANRHTRGRPYALADLAYRVYVRHRLDFPRVQAEVAALVGPGAAVAYVQADVCRADLLVEIEAQAFAAVGSD